MSEDTQRWQLGDVRFTAVVEAETVGIPPEFFFPDASADLVRSVDLEPGVAGEDGTIGLRVQAVVIEAGGRTVLVDPCVGNHKPRSQFFWDQQDWPFMERFRAAGFTPEGIDLVVHTHLHADHVGWDTHLVDGRWAPTFTNARHLYVDGELARLRASAEGGTGTDRDPDDAALHGDSVAPIVDAGLADIVAADTDLGDGLRLVPTFGHTPHHVALWVDTPAGSAALVGDSVLHPLQCALPELAFAGDQDVDATVATRKGLLDEVAASGALLMPAHFPARPVGRVRAEGAAWRFVPEEASTGA
jgi:glyoxylase-like metal-dependent hydrolase (beta-lactamase superfamily II)